MTISYESFIYFLDYYRFWLNSIGGFSDPEAQVIVVGTHADQISTEVSCNNKINHYRKQS